MPLKLDQRLCRSGAGRRIFSDCRGQAEFTVHLAFSAPLDMKLEVDRYISYRRKDTTAIAAEFLIGSRLTSARTTSSWTSTETTKSYKERDREEDVMKINVLCVSPERFKAFNEIYKRYFPNNPPARIFFCVPVWTGPFDIEIDCIAVRKD
jgi:hypothetical protein